MTPSGQSLSRAINVLQRYCPGFIPLWNFPSAVAFRAKFWNTPRKRVTILWLLLGLDQLEMTFGPCQERSPSWKGRRVLPWSLSAKCQELWEPRAGGLSFRMQTEATPSCCPFDCYKNTCSLSVAQFGKFGMCFIFPFPWFWLIGKGWGRSGDAWRC